MFKPGFVYRVLCSWCQGQHVLKSVFPYDIKNVCIAIMFTIGNEKYQLLITYKHLNKQKSKITL